MTMNIGSHWTTCLFDKRHTTLVTVAQLRFSEIFVVIECIGGNRMEKGF